MVDCKDFIARYYGGVHDEHTLRDIERFIDLINSPKYNFLENYTDSSYLISLFYIQKTGGVSVSHYKKIKWYIVRLLDYYGVEADIPNRLDVLETQRVMCLFRNLDGLFDFIDDIGSNQLVGYNTYSDLLNVKTIVALGWYGLSIMQIMRLPNKCVRETDGNYYLEAPEGKLIPISKRVYTYIDAYASSDGHRWIPSGRKVFYRSDGSLLIRGRTMDMEGGNIVACTLQRFNAVVPKSDGRAILFRNLKKNAMFCEILNDDDEQDIFAKIKNDFGYSEDQAYNYGHEYNRWVSLIKSNKI